VTNVSARDPDLRYNRRSMTFLENTPWFVLIIAAVLLGLAPFGSEPHLVEKWRMLFAGTLRKPIDWFDLVMHTTPIALLILKAIVTMRKT
jgi:hypothetical protein